MQEQIRQTFQTRRALLWSLVPRYQQASPAQKTLLLDVLVEWTGYTRKHAIKLLNHGEPDQPLCDSIVMSLCFASLRFPTQSVLPLLAPCKQLPPTCSPFQGMSSASRPMSGIRKEIILLSYVVLLHTQGG